MKKVIDLDSLRNASKDSITYEQNLKEMELKLNRLENNESIEFNVYGRITDKIIEAKDETKNDIIFRSNLYIGALFISVYIATG